MSGHATTPSTNLLNTPFTQSSTWLEVPPKYNQSSKISYCKALKPIFVSLISLRTMLSHYTGSKLLIYLSNVHVPQNNRRVMGISRPASSAILGMTNPRSRYSHSTYLISIVQGKNGTGVKLRHWRSFRFKIIARCGLAVCKCRASTSSFFCFRRDPNSQVSTSAKWTTHSRGSPPKMNSWVKLQPISCSHYCHYPSPQIRNRKSFLKYYLTSYKRITANGKIAAWRSKGKCYLVNPRLSGTWWKKHSTISHIGSTIPELWKD